MGLHPVPTLLFLLLAHELALLAASPVAHDLFRCFGAIRFERDRILVGFGVFWLFLLDPSIIFNVSVSRFKPKTLSGFFSFCGGWFHMSFSLHERPEKRTWIHNAPEFFVLARRLAKSRTRRTFKTPTGTPLYQLSTK